MPALPNVSKVVRSALEGKWSSGGIAVNRFYVRYSGSAPSSADLTAFAGTLATAWSDNMSAHVHEDFEITGATCIDLSSPTSAEGAVVVGMPGALTGGLLPADACLVMANLIGRRYRGGHPRVYLVAGDDTKITTEQFWDPTFVSTIEGAWAALISEYAAGVWSSGGTITHVNVSYFEGFTVVISPTTGRARNIPSRRSPPLVDDVLTYAGRTRIGSQRRRYSS